jgi:paraquat-inducible protein A
VQEYRVDCVCHECALTVRMPVLNEREKALCPRCGCTLSIAHKNLINRLLALSLTALIFMTMTLPFEFLSFQANGIGSRFTIAGSFELLFEDQHYLLAITLLFTAYVIPAVILIAFVYLLIKHKMNSKMVMFDSHLFHFLFKLLPWGMVEIFLLGVLVSLIKMVSMADVGVGYSFWAFVGYAIATTAVSFFIDKQQLYGLLKIAPDRSHEQLPSVHQRKLSIQYTWAYLLTAVVLLFPANFMPIMTTRLFGQDEPSTILGGVMVLWESGSVPIAIVIFIASVFIPIAKILVLAWLNYSVQVGHDLRHGERMLMYRIAEFIGRWSMIDIFVVIVLVCLIQLGNTMTVLPGPATISFSAVVVITMLAAMSFEPRLIWNNKIEHE